MKALIFKTVIVLLLASQQSLNANELKCSSAFGQSQKIVTEYLKSLGPAPQFKSKEIAAKVQEMISEVKDSQSLLGIFHALMFDYKPHTEDSGFYYVEILRTAYQKSFELKMSVEEMNQLRKILMTEAKYWIRGHYNDRNLYSQLSYYANLEWGSALGSPAVAAARKFMNEVSEHEYLFEVEKLANEFAPIIKSAQNSRELVRILRMGIHQEKVYPYTGEIYYRILLKTGLERSYEIGIEKEDLQLLKRSIYFETTRTNTKSNVSSVSTLNHYAKAVWGKSSLESKEQALIKYMNSVRNSPISFSPEKIISIIESAKDSKDLVRSLRVAYTKKLPYIDGARDYLESLNELTIRLIREGRVSREVIPEISNTIQKTIGFYSSYKQTYTVQSLNRFLDKLSLLAN